MAAVEKAYVAGTMLGTSLAPVYTVPENRRVIWMEVDLLNIHDADSAKATLHAVPPAGSAADANAVFQLQDGNAVRPGEKKPYTENQFYPAGTDFQAKASAADRIRFRMSLTLEVLE